MNQHLQKCFPNRSLEAIKGKCRQEAYREMVRGFCQEILSRCTTGIDEGEGAGAAMIGADAAPAAIETEFDDQNAPLPAPKRSSQRLRDMITNIIEQSPLDVPSSLSSRYPRCDSKGSSPVEGRECRCY